MFRFCLDLCTVFLYSNVFFAQYIVFNKEIGGGVVRSIQVHDTLRNSGVSQWYGNIDDNTVLCQNHVLMIISSLCMCNESSNSRESVVFLSSLSQDVVTSFTVRMSRCCKGEILQADGKKVLDKTAGLHLFSRLQLIASLTGETMKCEERLKLIL